MLILRIGSITTFALYYNHHAVTSQLYTVLEHTVHRGYRQTESYAEKYTIRSSNRTYRAVRRPVRTYLQAATECSPAWAARGRRQSIPTLRTVVEGACSPVATSLRSLHVACAFVLEGLPVGLVASSQCTPGHAPCSMLHARPRRSAADSARRRLSSQPKPSMPIVGP